MLISPSEIHHLVDVLRFSVGEEVQLLDGNGGRYLSQIETIAPSRVEFKILISKRPQFHSRFKAGYGNRFLHRTF